MIRREIRLPDGAPGWMLISQVEHARVSALLASHCTQPLIALQDRAVASPPSDAGSSAVSIRAEVLAAVAHHDDGWAQWEQNPRLDPQLGRPLSFMEIEPHEAFAIWSASIDAAATIGPLAAWMVAGHFSRLLGHSHTPGEKRQGVPWQTDVERRRDGWLAAWRAVDPERHAPSVAHAAHQWLWTFDEASLWLCSTSRSGGRFCDRPDGAYQAGKGTPLAMEFRVPGAGVDAGDEIGLATVMPWRFDQEVIETHISGQLVPARKYDDPAELLATAAPGTLRWRLSSAGE